MLLLKEAGVGGQDWLLLCDIGEGGAGDEDEAGSYSEVEGHLGFFLEVLERRRCFKIISYKFSRASSRPSPVIAHAG